MMIIGRSERRKYRKGGDTVDNANLSLDLPSSRDISANDIL